MAIFYFQIGDRTIPKIIPTAKPDNAIIPLTGLLIKKNAFKINQKTHCINMPFKAGPICERKNIRKPPKTPKIPASAAIAPINPYHMGLGKNI